MCYDLFVLVCFASELQEIKTCISGTENVFHGATDKVKNSLARLSGFLIKYEGV